MKLSGDAVLHAPAEAVWDTLLDPAVLVRTIPGCERLETTGEHTYAMTVNVGVSAIRGTYAGTCSLGELQPPSSLLLSAQGAGAPGTIGSAVNVRLEDLGDGTTSLSYEADVLVGGMIAGVGQRMLGSVSRRLAGEFFEAVDQVLLGMEHPVMVPTEPTPGAMPAVYTAPPPPVDEQRAFLRGMAVGAGLVAVGVALGVLRERGR